MKLFLKQYLPLGILTGLLVLAGVGCTSDEEAQVEDIVEVSDDAKAEEEALPVEETASVDLSSVTVLFGFDEAILGEAERAKLDAIVPQLKKDETLKITIEGHADERGSIEYNLALGESRANAVRAHLTSMGVKAEQVATISYGEEKPAAIGHDESAYAQNRRASFSADAH
jgi:peptidoglycan-associated lipoprotein